jgi:hypothetical protein
MFLKGGSSHFVKGENSYLKADEVLVDKEVLCLSEHETKDGDEFRNPE